MTDCLFCRIIAGDIPARKVFEDQHTFAFEDINPQAPTHVLVVPKKHIPGLKESSAEDAETIGRCHLTLGICRNLDISSKTFGKKEKKFSSPGPRRVNAFPYYERVVIMAKK